MRRRCNDALLPKLVGGGGGGGSDPATLRRVSDQYPPGSLADGAGAFLTVTTGSAHAPGSWVEVDASLSADAAGVTVNVDIATSGSTTNTSTILEIGTGAGGAEVVWAQINLGYLPRGTILHVPGFIASGTRVAVRVRSVQATTDCYMRIGFIPVISGYPPAAPTSLGVDTTTSKGTVLTAAGGANTKSAWKEISASAGPFSILGLYLSCGGSTSVQSARYLIDIGVGAAAAEAAVISNVGYITESTERLNQERLTVFGVDIPAGSRIVARYEADHASQPAPDVILVGA